MAELLEQTVTETTPEMDLVAVVRQVLQASDEPLTLAKIKASLPARLRAMSVEDLTASLQRQVAANVFYQYPKYRSPQDRYWDRPMNIHLANLLQATLQEQPLAWAEIKRKIPDYARTLAESVLEEQVAKGLLHRYPSTSKRGGPRFSAQPPCPKDFLRTELTGVFHRLEQLGFTLTQLRESALELLHEEEWSSSEEMTPTTTSASMAPPAMETTPATETAAALPANIGYTVPSEGEMPVPEPMTASNEPVQAPVAMSEGQASTAPTPETSPSPTTDH